VVNQPVGRLAVRVQLPVPGWMGVWGIDDWPLEKLIHHSKHTLFRFGAV
jgi:hypothetical protein